MPADLREPVDMREIMLRLADADSLLEFKSGDGPATVCAQASLAGHAIGFMANNGPIDVAGASKATRFIRWLCQCGHPIVYLQNTTGYRVGESEQADMARYGSEMIRAVADATVPQLTIQCGASFGAGNYAMCGRAHAPRFLFSWPGAKTALVGGEQAAPTMQPVDEVASLIEAQSDAFHTSGLLLDDGVIDPRDTRAVLAFCLDTIAEAANPRAGIARKPLPQRP